MSTDAPQEERDELLATMLQQGQIREELAADEQASLTAMSAIDAQP